jgi:hypothetical protein
VRSLLCGLAAIWFIYNAFTFIPPIGAYLNRGAPGGIDGDPGAVALTWAARQVFIGLALLSLALVDWERKWKGFRSIGGGRRDADS